MVYSGLAGVALLTPTLPFVWVTPSPVALGLMVFMGLAAALGHWLLIQAHARAPAGVLFPFMYTQIVWMILGGYLVFGDVPDRFVVLGAAIVVASGVYLLHRERAQGARPGAPDPA